MPRYSDQFRNKIIQKMIGPERRSAPDLAKEYGISVATIYGWKSKLKDGTLSVMSRESSSNERSPSEKLISTRSEESRRR
ncbi:MAG: transposase [Spirochaetaceae bacterium]|nr:transposase [Spirochaetaceae bacterium]